MHPEQLICLILDALAGTFFPVLARVDDEIDEVEDDTWSFFVLGLGLMIPAVVGFLLFLRNRDWL